MNKGTFLPESRAINMVSKKTIDYYDSNASAYTTNTIDVDFAEMRIRFLKKLPADAYILDFGCGTGRDTKAFLEQGFTVEAVDGSERMCEIACKHTGIPVKHMYFQNLEEVDRYDGIWACASILHLTHEELEDVLRRVARALKDNGILYVSFKYGTFEGERNGRYFTDMTKEMFEELMEQFPEFVIEEEWISQDIREERGDEKWLNLILRKV